MTSAPVSKTRVAERIKIIISGMGDNTLSHKLNLPKLGLTQPVFVLYMIERLLIKDNYPLIFNDTYHLLSPSSTLNILNLSFT
ncbi:hypothetical protein E2C01_046433 [Portunus trituberculatus]|uniref:Uncharacterized protein n=1 Tax=Portunus trituberculatus TaxID=210409 RepID=A0A5B7G0Y6_PORTR|nr:hypothetical protein [Portunus trituberculatus]